MLCLGFLLPALNCATIFDGAKKPYERTSDIQWGFFVLDLLVFWPGLIVDFSTGAIYKSNDASKSESGQNLQEYASAGIPCYRVSADGLYKIEMSEGQLKEAKIEPSTLPPVVWQAIEKEKSNALGKQ